MQRVFLKKLSVIVYYKFISPRLTDELEHDLWSSLFGPGLRMETRSSLSECPVPAAHLCSASVLILYLILYCSWALSLDALLSVIVATETCLTLPV